MRDMKESGIEGIDLVPESWDRVQLEHCAYIIRGGSPRPIEQYMSDTDEGYSWIKIGDTEKGNKYITHVREKIISAGLSKTRYVKEGTLLLTNSMSFGEPYILKVNGCIHDGWLAFSNLKLIDKEFLYYFLVSPACRVQFEKASDGGVVQNLNIDKVKHSIIYFPDISEQHVIANYLDFKCAEIDALSADIQSEIETLEAYKRSVITEAVTKGLDRNAVIKDSEVFYMAPYNASWRLSKIGYECTKLCRAFSAEDIPLLCTNKGKVSIRPDEMSGRMVSEDNAMQGIHKGDIAIHGMDTWHGAIALSEYDGKITRVVHVCDSHHDKRFIVYYLQQLAFNGVYKLISNGVRGNTSDFRSWDKVSDIYIALPSRSEQILIADYLDNMCKEVEGIIAQKQEQLTVLADYKKSVIYEYVTGKKEVPMA